MDGQGYGQAHTESRITPLSLSRSLSLSHLPAPLAVDGVFRGPFFSFALLLVFYNGVLVLRLSYSPTMVPWRLKSFFRGGFP